MTPRNNRKAIVAGAGFAGLSAAISLAHAGFEVTILEKHDQTGGRARVWRHKGFSFDMGPSWYWMPEVIEQFFQRFGRSIHDYISLQRLNPSYQVIFDKEEVIKIPAGYKDLKAVFEAIEKGSSTQLDNFIQQAAFKYEAAMKTYISTPGIHVKEYLNREVLSSLFRMDMFGAFSTHARKYFHSKKLLRIIEFPVLFLGEAPEHIPAMYSLMNYADIIKGTWYPRGGMHELCKAMTALAEESGVTLRLNTEVKAFNVKENLISGVVTDKEELHADVIVAAMDYRHTDQELLPQGCSNYSSRYWDKRQMAPSCLLYFVGVKRKLPGLIHHNLFFEDDFAPNAASIYKNKTWPEEPLFYICCPSKTDDTVAPQGMENLFFLIPTAPGLQDTPEIREYFYEKVIAATEAFCKTSFRQDIIVQRSYACSDFVQDYNAFKGNAYGLANTLRQTAILKPSIRHKKIRNLFYTGQLTVPGPGVPPAIISGQVVAGHITKTYKHAQHEVAF